MKRDNQVEPVLLLISGLLIFFAFAIVFCEYRFPNDGQVFQVFSGITTSLAGALLMRVKPAGKNDTPEVSAKTTTTDGTTESVVTSTTT